VVVNFNRSFGSPRGIRLMNKFVQFSLISIAWLAAGGSFTISAQVRGGKNRQDLIDRGKYIVESVAMCERCHTQRDQNGAPDRAHWLMGGPTQTRPTYSDPNWAIVEPRLAGAPPGTDAEFIRLLTTGIARTGRPPDPPMPSFRMTRDDAEAVLAYLKSLRR
jgi:mono/diheme cytochrome c family protein